MVKKITIFICIILLPFSITACTKSGYENKGSSIYEVIPETENINTIENTDIKEHTTDKIKETITYKNSDFVNIIDYIPNAVIDLKYSTPDNFTGCIIYNFTEAYLRYGTTLKLQNAQQQLEKLGYTIKIWDAFRPFEAQVALWNAYPNGNYVANPQKGYTSHNLGNTVDITIVTLADAEVNMPTTFDDFTAKANRDYSDVSQEQADHAILLETIMTNCGFKGYSNEWWHYEDVDLYEPDETFLPPVRNSSFVQ